MGRSRHERVDEAVSVPVDAVADVKTVMTGLAEVLEMLRSEVWGQHARTHAEHIRALVNRLPTVDMSSQDPADWQGAFAAYIYHGTIDYPVVFTPGRGAVLCSECGYQQSPVADRCANCEAKLW